MQENHVRSVIKGASWRIVGTIDTIFLSFIYTGQVVKAFKIGGVELFTKIFLFYLHERVWMRLKFGTEEVKEGNEIIIRDKHYRSIIKGASWRVIGSLDTFWIALVVNSDSAHPTQTAFYIAATEVITKIGLFWLHERIWMRVKWGAKPDQVLQPTAQ
jgi:uncharacterized membrane protein